MHQEPEITAEFELEPDGSPVKKTFNGVDHFKVKLSVKSAPASAYAVTYQLHETFRDPVREVRKADEATFAQDILTYGNFSVHAKIRTREGVQLVSRDLSKALMLTYGAQPSAPIQKAIEKISRL